MFFKKDPLLTKSGCKTSIVINLIMTMVLFYLIISGLSGELLFAGLFGLSEYEARIDGAFRWIAFVIIPLIGVPFALPELRKLAVCLRYLDVNEINSAHLSEAMAWWKATGGNAKKREPQPSQYARAANPEEKQLISCPDCGAKLRVPVNKGMIRVTCPACHNSFHYFSGSKPQK